MRRLGFLLALPAVLMAILAIWTVRGEHERAAAAVRRDAGHAAELALQKLDGIPDLAVVEVPFAAIADHPPSPLAERYDETRRMEPEAATRVLADLREDPALAEARSDTGTPLEPLVLLAQLRTAPEEARHATAESLRASILRLPSSLSHRLMRDAALHLEPPLARESLSVALEHERIVEHLEIAGGDWSSGEQRPHWPRRGDRAVFHADRVAVTPLPRLRALAATRLADQRHSLPPYLALRVIWRGENLAKADGETLAERRGGEFAVSAVLANPGLHGAELRRRVAWIAALLGCAVAVAAAGSWATWRAFKRQRELAALQSDFIASVSHELRTPVTSIGVLAERLESGELDDAPGKVAEYHRFIGREGRRLSALVENVLDFSRIEQGRKAYDFEHADLARLVREASELVRPYAEERELGLRTHIDLPDDAATPKVDAMAMRQALVNLMDNAIKFTPAGGEVTVGLAQGENGSRDGIRMWVADTGPGIPEKDRARIFDRFYRADNGLRRETTGAGIGLSLVKHIVDAHEGTVRVESAPEKGSVFTVELRPQSDDD